VVNQPFPLTINLGSNKFSTADFILFNPYSTVIPGSLPASQSLGKGVNKVAFNANDYAVLLQIIPN